ncbi:hypothetical protein [Streptomyces sp. V2]|uniref:Uncharacterized protein n=1 Tax=Streptomyces niveiscabiei TaxID=164115 RepID=A0ABW9HWJ3_9ACTN|nr:hypothetical protein [Streptomyces sp. V2]
MTDVYETTHFAAEADVSATLVLRGKDSGGCARAFTNPELGVQEIVKENGDTKIDLGTRCAGAGQEDVGHGVPVPQGAWPAGDAPSTAARRSGA